ncbi:hypothetical protein ACFFX1_34935 [Dactylosporangium sucinum]|uniref:Uncharacterized protein n=1 Tax=Dactylosporangium sucinum TaxID=1424081 RepID=A0A917U1B8_9ACTN|nr:hypothetical protein [Dactylosporangium sucinum]GGM50489.1 hypothetical protein GCM10007977_060290 [Dactylosporangium sucinum]
MPDEAARMRPRRGNGRISGRSQHGQGSTDETTALLRTEMRSSSATSQQILEVTVVLEGASKVAWEAFGRSVQAYADQLAHESGRQEITSRAVGATIPEITATSVIRASEVLEHPPPIEPRRLTTIDKIVLSAIPIFSGAAGIMGSFLHSVPQVLVFSGIASVAVVCIFFDVWRRLH